MRNLRMKLVWTPTAEMPTWSIRDSQNIPKSESEDNSEDIFEESTKSGSNQMILTFTLPKR